MGEAPAAALGFVIIGMVFQSLMFGSVLVNGAGISGDLDPPEDFGLSDLGDAIGFAVDVIALIVRIPLLVFDLATFAAVPGLPPWIRAPLSLFNLLVLGGWAFRIVTSAGSLIPFT